MRSFEMTLELIALFSAAAVAAFALHRAPWKRQKSLVLVDGSALRLRSAGGIHRTRMLHSTDRGWRIAAPLSRDAYVPIREGETITVEAPTSTGVLHFRSLILGRDPGSHTLEIERPAQWFLSERREMSRLTEVDGISVSVDDAAAKLMDLSEHGMRLTVAGRFARGERVGVSVPWSQEPLYAWVLDSRPAAFGKFAGAEMRLRLEEPVDVRGVRAVGR